MYEIDAIIFENIIRKVLYDPKKPNINMQRTTRVTKRGFKLNIPIQYLQ
jgi:hypothetical protein